MDIEIKYRAKDGVCFDDINECEEYEKNLQNQRGCLGYLIKKLKKYKELLEKGEISREEYEYWKQETLNTNC